MCGFISIVAPVNSLPHLDNEKLVEFIENVFKVVGKVTLFLDTCSTFKFLAHPPLKWELD
jgi:hypothetical protein